MMRETPFKQIKYDINFQNINIKKDSDYSIEYSDIYKKIKTAMEIDREGYNVYIIDDFSNKKLNNIVHFIKEGFKNKNKPRDICYVVVEDERIPKPIFLLNGNGNKLKNIVESIQNDYLETVYEFYNGTDIKEKEDLIDNVEKSRGDLVSKMMKMAKENGFDIRFTSKGFTFIPLNGDGELMSEKDYEILEKNDKDDILDKVSYLKQKAQGILGEIKKIEQEEIEKIKDIMKNYFTEVMRDKKIEYVKDFSEESALSFIDQICEDIEKQLIDNYSMNYEDDEEGINEIIYKYVVNVLVDNSENSSPPVIYEDDPNVNNLLGNIEYENKNGMYITDVSLIKAGSMLKANEGCLILRVNNLVANSLAYYYLKKSLINNKVNIDYNRGYLELLSLSGLKPTPIDIKEKIILIGDYQTYDLLYNYDEDFKKLFKIKVEYNPILNVDENTKKAFLDDLFKICKDNRLIPLTDNAIKEVAKFLSRKAENRNKICFDCYELDKILTIANNDVKNSGRNFIEDDDIIKAAYCEELIEKEILDLFEENKILMNVNGKLVGQINGLTVINTGYFSFGKPARITCTCYKGDGNIIDVQKDSELSGKIHTKAVNILKGYMNSLNGGYSKIPVDFHLSFEQLYGKIDGDSASIAEIVSMISALSKIGIKQNIAVTGSANQFGEVQPIGGVNEKIEGFFKVCKAVDKVQGKGVLIPYSNMDNLVLSREVESEVEKNNFHIYTMNNVEDAVNVLMGDDEISFKDVMDSVEKELKKYNSNKKK